MIAATIMFRFFMIFIETFKKRLKLIQTNIKVRKKKKEIEEKAKSKKRRSSDFN